MQINILEKRNTTTYLQTTEAWIANRAPRQCYPITLRLIVSSLSNPPFQVKANPCRLIKLVVAGTLKDEEVERHKALVHY